MTQQTDRLNTALASRYRVERELGAGGMATVYLAHDERHDRSVALKVLKPELAAVIGADRFLNEIKTTANLQHPHILALHDSGEVDGTVWYVMPLVEGESLRDRLFDASAYHTNQFLPMYDVAPDGRLLMLKHDAETARTDLVVIRGWVQQVMKRLESAK